MNKVMDMVISAVIKKGILYEARNCDLEFDIPTSQLSGSEETGNGTIKIKFKAENMKLQIEKDK